MKTKRITPAGPARLTTVTRQRAAGMGHHSCERVQVTSCAEVRQVLDARSPVSTPTPAMPGISALTKADVPCGTITRLSKTTPTGRRSQSVRRCGPANTRISATACGETRCAAGIAYTRPGYGRAPRGGPTPATSDVHAVYIVQPWKSHVAFRVNDVEAQSRGEAIELYGEVTFVDEEYPLDRGERISLDPAGTARSASMLPLPRGRAPSRNGDLHPARGVRATLRLQRE